MSPHPETPEQTVARFWSRVDVRGPNECWNWTGEIWSHGRYGRFSIWPKSIRKSFMAHRYSVELSGRVIPAGHVVMHLCDNGHCVNPAHLEIGTQRDNIHDCIAKGRQDRSGLALGRGREGGKTPEQRRRIAKKRAKEAS